MEANIDQLHPFGSPIYVLENSLQSQKSHIKWSDQACVRIFMCYSPHHSTSVPLVLNTQLGNFSPQFHCIYDDDFKTCKRDSKFQSLWQSKDKFQTVSKVTSTINVLPTSIFERESGLPETSEPFPHLLVPWDAEFTIQTDVDEPAVPTVPDPVEPVVHYQQHQPIPFPEPAPDDTTQSGCRVHRLLFFKADHANCVFLHTLSTDKSDESVALL